MKLSYHFTNSKAALEADPGIVATMKRALQRFPNVECPQPYKEVLCALVGLQDMEKFLREPLGALGGKCVLQLLEAKDYSTLEKYLEDGMALVIAGPGAL
jgi:hypothetical protein